MSLCVSGTPVSDTVCIRCPAGHFSSSDSSAEPCQPHRNCTHLGLKTLRWGSATSDSLCASQDKTAALDCSQHQALCSNGKRPDWKLFSCKASRGAQNGPGWRSEGPEPLWGTQIPEGSDLWGLRPKALRSGCAQISGGFRPRLRVQTWGVL